MRSDRAVLAVVVLLLAGGLSSCRVDEAAVARDIDEVEDVARQGPPFAKMLPVVAQHGMAGTLQPLATQVALDVLKAGGNAVDAAIAANAATAVLLPTSNGLGGDMFAIVWIEADRRLYGLNASGRGPLGVTLEELRTAAGGDTLPARGPLSALTVPGVVDGWFELHGRWGTKPMPELLAPAIRYAREGAPGRGWGANTELASQPGFAETFLPNDGRGPRPGELFRNPGVANTLELIARGGRDAFYRGEIAETVSRFCERVGCYLRQEDFAAHESEWVEPLGVEFGGYTLWQLPPNGQGLVALQMLRILEGFDLRAMGHNSPEYLHHLIEAKKLAFEDRGRYYADPQWVEVPVQELLSDEHIDRHRRRLDPTRAATSIPAEDPRLGRDETTYLTVADGQGNMVSLIQSNYAGPGSGLTPDGLGFGLHNRGSSFSLTPGHPNVFEPGKRPFHTIIPGFITRDGAAYMSLGATGGDMQPQVAVQIFLNHVLFGMDVQEAGDAARFRHNGSTDPRGAGLEMTDGGCVALETALQPQVRTRLERMGHVMCAPDELVGGRYIGIRKDPGNGVYWGAVETRAYGQVSGW